MRSSLLWIADALAARYGVPPRVSSEPVEELIRTVLSQNTTDGNRDRAFAALRSAFPSWFDAADAPEGKLADLLRPAGLANTRARRIKAILSRVLSEDDLGRCRTASIPECSEYLMALPGVGIKTAYVVLLFSFGRPVFPMDTHIFRIFTRFGLLGSTHNSVREHIRFSSLVPDGRHADLHLNLLRLGRGICRARKPDCPVCPLMERCRFTQRNPGGAK